MRACAPRRASSARKRLAVPFRAAHMPSVRSEFSHPDVALTLTTLSYYYDGLSRVQVLEAVSTLLAQDGEVPGSWFAEWRKLQGPLPSGACVRACGKNSA